MTIPLITRSRALMCVLAMSIGLFSGLSLAELENIDDESMSDIGGQGGLAVSGTFDINTYGGPQWGVNRNADGTPIQNPDGTYLCGANGGKCGARFAVLMNDFGPGNQGWLVLDNIQGGIEFGDGVDASVGGQLIEGSPMELTTDVRQKGGETVPVLKLKLSNVLRYNNVNATLATAGDAISSANQVNLLSLQIDGDVVGRGNILLFPTD